MKKAMLILLSVAAYTFSLNDVSVPNRFTPSTPARSSEVNANFDTLAGRINQNNDTIEQKFIRFSDLESGDSILEKCRIDTARIDHIRSNPEADSMTISKVDINGGTIDGTVIGANSAAAGTFTTVTASGVDINGGTIDGTVIGANSAAAGTFTTVTVNGYGVWHSGNFNPDYFVQGTNNRRMILTNSTNPLVSNEFCTFFRMDNTDPSFDSRLTGGVGLGLKVINNSNPYSFELMGQASGNGVLLFGGTDHAGVRYPWLPIWHGGNFNPADYQPAITGTGNKVLSIQADGTGVKTGSIYDNGNVALIGKTTATGGYRLEVEGNTLVNGTLKADSIKSTKGINCSTINTGFGNFEIGQNLRTTDNVFFNKTTANDMTVNDTIRIGSVLGQQVQIYDGWYLEGNYLCTLSGFTSTVTCTTYYVKCGKAVTLTFSTAAGMGSNTDCINISTGLMPASIRPAREMFWPLTRWSFSGLLFGYELEDTDPRLKYIQTPNNVFTISLFQSSSYKAIRYSFSISYLTY